ncbi:MAG: phosphoenolpyruvate mutase [Deltaproteobacteria bacterium]|nr:phosphoenolpyruvate mutase [Deltaproteobacteria bacterium]MBW2382741.1 phosphoenolpyruvate mutase [Deltaproteobacteria bacterium]MBW2695609.1 phosphoenolpyruvate mutase [Deltaproteobacteria bacterium]
MTGTKTQKSSLSNPRKLRNLLESPKVEHILEAHNALSASLVEEAGIPGLWASSLTLSCAAGLRDNSELTMSEVLDTLESITAKVQIPILFDGDTGYGQFSHFQQLVRKLCLREVGGVCIEDKVFPKTNSFLRSEGQSLAPVDEFCGKLRAGKDAQSDPDFIVAARTEALITGLDVSEAIDRTERYAEAGADAVLIHSKARTFAQVQEFLSKWSGAVPVICVPTTYYATPMDAFQQAGVSLVIWANHMLRASIGAMQDLANHIGRSGTARDLEDKIVPVKEIFRLQDADGLLEGEKVYLNQGSSTSAVVLAASRGRGLDELTRDKPKAMIPISGTPAIEKMLQSFRAEGIKDISIVRGYMPEALAPAGASFFENPGWEQTGELGSLSAARSALKGDVVIAYGDTIFKRYILQLLLSSDAPITIAVDGSCSFLDSGRSADRVKISGPSPTRYTEEEFVLEQMTENLSDAEADGEWIGMLRTKGEGTERLVEALDEVLALPESEKLDMCAVFERLVARDPQAVRVIYVQGDWIDINSLADVARGGDV